ncbi:hypothetical protein ABW20_dc0102824 [Dactylellina cionopaga]|nr:hypothetical protein ABW20_dc0102824 [Dactylellina cionopaga]
MLIAYLFTVAIHRLYFSPLAKIPGPWWAAISRLWLLSRVAKARAAFDIHGLHEQYGSYVRIGPNEISISEINSVKRIHSVHDPYHKSAFYKRLGSGLGSIFFIVDQEAYKHRRMAYGNAFSKSNISLMEPVVRKHVETCVNKLKREINNNKTPDMMSWIQFMSTDIIGEICYGQDFGMLKNETLQPILHDAVAAAIILTIRGHVPGWSAMESLLLKIPHTKIQRIIGCERRISDYGTEALANLRSEVENCKNGKTRPSLFSTIIDKSNDPRVKHKMTMEEVKQEALLVIIAGSHTVTVVGTYILWAIFKHKEVRRRLEAELGTANMGDDILTDEKLQNLPYFNQVLKEGLRLYPAGQIPPPRVVPSGSSGRQLGPYFFPPGTEVITPIYTIQRDPILFPDPHSFIPERWENPSKNMESAILTFGGASRPCLGQQLGMMELRLLAATLLKSCPEATLADSCTDDSMEFVEYMSIRPKANKCELQKDRSW